MTLGIGETTEIQGSGSKPYIIKNVDGRIWSCTCPSWKNSGGPVDRKSCKHLRQLLGEAAEAARIGAAVTQANTTTAVATPASPNAPAAPRASAAGSVAAGRHASGEKLRQDEKAKLFGPKLLLANPWDGELDPAGWWLSEKADGVRAFWDGEAFISRQGNKFYAPSWFTANLPKHPLDGELWMGRQMFQKTISVVKSQDSGERWRQVTYVVFDHPSHLGPFEDRMKYLLELESNLNHPHMRILRQIKVRDRDHVAKELDLVVSQGGEGLMLRKPGSLYEACRSDTLLKVKKFSDAEAVVVSHTIGKGRHLGRLGALVVRMPNGKEFNIGTGFSDADRRDPPPVGATITYSFTEHTESGLPKCAAFLRVRPQE